MRANTTTTTSTANPKYRVFMVFLAVSIGGLQACTQPADEPAAQVAEPQTAVVESAVVEPANVVAESEAADPIGISNFSRFDGEPGFGGSPVGFGGATGPAAMPWLKSEGFKAVINLRLATEDGADIDGDRAAAETAGLQYIHLPFNPKGAKPEDINAILDAAGDPANQPVYIHCHSGTRVAALWMIGRVQRDGWDIEAAAEEARTIAEKPDESIGFATAYLKAAQKQ